MVLSRAHVGSLTFTFKIKFFENSIIFFFTLYETVFKCAQVCVYICIGIGRKHKNDRIVMKSKGKY